MRILEREFNDCWFIVCNVVLTNEHSRWIKLYTSRMLRRRYSNEDIPMYRRQEFADTRPLLTENHGVSVSLYGGTVHFVVHPVENLHSNISIFPSTILGFPIRVNYRVYATSVSVPITVVRLRANGMKYPYRAAGTLSCAV